MKACPLLIAVFLCSAFFSRSEDAATEPANLWLAEKLEPGIAWAELKEKLPELKPPEPYLANAPNLTSARDSFFLNDIAIPVTFQFNDDKLYGWSSHFHDMDQKTAIGLTDFLLSQFQSRYGPATRNIGLPFEHDGRRDEVQTSYIWKINQWDFSIMLSFRPQSATLGFGAGRTIMVNGHYFIADPDTPLRGMARGRNQPEPQPVEIVGQAGSSMHLHVLKKLHERGVTGSTPSRAHGLADFGQTIDIHGGRFVREEDGMTCLRLSWFQVKFPITIWREGGEGIRHAEVHFGMQSLFPEGIEFEGETLDLGRFEGWWFPSNQRPPQL